MGLGGLASILFIFFVQRAELAFVPGIIQVH